MKTDASSLETVGTTLISHDIITTEVKMRDDIVLAVEPAQEELDTTENITVTEAPELESTPNVGFELDITHDIDIPTPMVISTDITYTSDKNDELQVDRRISIDKEKDLPT